jgi:D-arabinose 1-dehydrogenase-like Zn-dependent alcohol dehydrogenase
MVQVARLYGADVAGLDAVEDKLGYLETELSVHAVDSSDFDAVRLPNNWAGGADVVVDLLGNHASLAWSLRSLRPNGRLIVLTTFRDVDFEASPRDLVLSQVSIMGSRYARRAELQLAARIVAAGRVRPIVTRRVGLDQLDAVHDELRSGTLLGRGALVWRAGRDDF